MSPQREDKKQRSTHTSQKLGVLRRRLDFLRKQQEEHAGEPNGYRAKEIDALGWLLETLSTEGCSGCEPGEPPCFSCRVHGVAVARRQLDAKNVAVNRALVALHRGHDSCDASDKMDAISEAIEILEGGGRREEVSDVRE